MSRTSSDAEGRNTFKGKVQFVSFLAEVLVKKSAIPGRNRMQKTVWSGGSRREERVEVIPQKTACGASPPNLKYRHIQGAGRTG